MNKEQSIEEQIKELKENLDKLHWFITDLTILYNKNSIEILKKIDELEKLIKK